MYLRATREPRCRRCTSVTLFRQSEFLGNKGGLILSLGGGENVVCSVGVHCLPVLVIQSMTKGNGIVYTSRGDRCFYDP